MTHFHFPPKASEYATSVILLNWSIIIWFTDGYNHFYGSMNKPMVWSFLFGTMSVLRLIVLYINGNLRRSPHLRSAFSFLTCFAWFQITLAFLAADSVTTGLGVYPVLLGLDFYNAYRTAVEARITDEGYKDAGNS